MNLDDLNQIVSLGESVEREFKSDRGRGINDKIIYEEVVALANTDGGILLIDVEDVGRISDAKPRHGESTEPGKLQSAIFNNTVPNINTRISIAGHDNGKVICIEGRHLGGFQQAIHILSSI